MIKEIKNIAEYNFNEIVKIRRFLHQNPELSFKEFNTSKYIQSLLSEHNIPFTNGHVETGIIATIKGKTPLTKKFYFVRIWMLYQLMKKMKLITALKIMVKCMPVVMMFIVLHFLEQH